MALTPIPTDLMAALAKTCGYGRGVIQAGTYPKLQSGDVETTFMEIHVGLLGSRIFALV
jgi:hypothetical protein